ncbi:putative transcriptional regulator (Cti6) [Penicillium brasilianum]|uniref:Putative transcriptional regulator (Cti6) n=1 Tax=Penicillium brasilianum TaxID=104259 RepID=A0A1S9S135_PENBI|nr:putative transcriptional regulator (Cti6) [Penicillium brasilianum]
MSPRRSSRARTTQPSPALLQHTNSSSSNNSLTRERSTRSNHKNPSPNGSSGHRSQSIDETENGSRADLPHTRQRQRTRGDNDPPREDDDEDPEEDEEEEITRCLCGQQDYPGLPPSRRDALGRVGVKPEEGIPPADSSDLLSDDLGSMFIQCDSCKVWQHGGCVGIMDEEMSPDEYFCEECRKDLHRIRGESNGQRSSTYLPVAPISSPAPSSRASSRDTSRRSRDPKSRGSEGASNPKRRSTMNSRDAAYDEEELIRRAIEESKEDTKSITDEAAPRLNKRSRSESESNRQGSKRPRTTSPSPTAASKQSPPPSQPPSDDETQPKATNGTRRQRATSRGQRDKEPTKEPEEPEPEVPETVPRRKERSIRRKGEESENDIGSPAKAAAPAPPPPELEPTQASPDTPTPQEPTPARPSTRKSGRPPARRGGRVGRNQYTKDRDTNGNGTESPRRGQSHDIGSDSPRVGYINGTHLNGGDTGRPSKPRHMHPQRTTMNEMKRRVAAILEFISRMQVEMAVASENSSTPTGNGDRAQGLLLKSMVDQIDSAMASTVSDGGESMPALTDGDGDAQSSSAHDKDFKDLSSVEMMDVLTRHLLKWQQEYGKFGER